MLLNHPTWVENHFSPSFGLETSSFQKMLKHHRNVKDGTPAGSDSIPAPTMFFTKFTSICCTPPEKIVKGISFAPWLLDQTSLVSVKLGHVFSPYLSSIFIRPAEFFGVNHVRPSVAIGIRLAQDWHPHSRLPDRA